MGLKANFGFVAVMSLVCCHQLWAQSEMADPPFDEVEKSVAEGIKQGFESFLPQGFKQRLVFNKMHACMRAKFSVKGDIPEELKIGLFKEPRLATEPNAWVRIATDGQPSNSDFENRTVGFSIKIFGVQGDKILEEDRTAQTHDFLMQNHPVFFTDNAAQFLDLTANGFDDAYIEAKYRDTIHQILNFDMKHKVGNVLESNYWSTTAYHFGANNHAKYKIVPCAFDPSTGPVLGQKQVQPAPHDPADPDPDPESLDQNYLKSRVQKDVLAKGGCFNFYVQLRKDDPATSEDEMPVDKSMTNWSEEASKPVHVATIEIPAGQNTEELGPKCSRLSFTVWHALPEHKPAGSVNHARGITYRHMSKIRRERAGHPVTEPEAMD